MKILLATNNSHKVEEIRKILKGFPGEILDLSSFKPVPEPVEDGSTYRDNALIKAFYYHRLTGLPTLADDSGIEIDAFDGAPGIYSARFIDPEFSFEQRNREVLRRMKELPDSRRGACFRCCCVLVMNPDRIITEYGVLEGMIAREIQGEYGFGYDPIFYLPHRKAHLAQIPPQEKNRISHRAKAFEKMKKHLLDLFDASGKILSPGTTH